jgi:transposase-like protein
VDETLLRINGENYYWLWLAYEPNLHVCLLLFHISTERTIFVCYQFFKQIRTRFGNKLIIIFTDGAQWYTDACKWLDLNILSTEHRSKILWKGSSNTSKTELNASMCFVA